MATETISATSKSYGSDRTYSLEAQVTVQNPGYLAHEIHNTGNEIFSGWYTGFNMVAAGPFWLADKYVVEPLDIKEKIIDPFQEQYPIVYGVAEKIGKVAFLAASIMTVTAALILSLPIIMYAGLRHLIGNIGAEAFQAVSNPLLSNRATRTYSSLESMPQEEQKRILKELPPRILCAVLEHHTASLWLERSGDNRPVEFPPWEASLSEVFQEMNRESQFKGRLNRREHVMNQVIDMLTSGNGPVPRKF